MATARIAVARPYGDRRRAERDSLNGNSCAGLQGPAIDERTISPVGGIVARVMLRRGVVIDIDG